MGVIEESLLLTTHNDLVSFITDYRKNCNGTVSQILHMQIRISRIRDLFSLEE